MLDAGKKAGWIMLVFGVVAFITWIWLIKAGLVF